MLDNLDKFSLPELEEKVLKFWKENDVFKKSLSQRKKAKKFVFYEGPPTANGRPGIHHVLGRSFKDIIPRYKTMAGFFAPRRAGWDTHGLPVEIEVEKKLGLKSKKEIEKYGIAAFNKKCRESVWEYQDEWERLTERIGFWLDLDNPYITYQTEYIETLWWILSEVHKKKLLYRGHKVVPWCTRCGTGLSSHELALGYKTVEDESVYMKFKLKPGQKIGGDFTTDDKIYILSWTTTPWTLPGNVALAVGESIEYAVVSVSGGEKYILAEARLGVLEKYEVVTKYKGKNLLGLSYDPLFNVSKLKTETAYKIYPADFVTTEDGTGVVHTAVMYGEDDYKLGAHIGLPRHHTVDEAGLFTADVPGLAGMYVKAKETEEKIFEILKKNNNLLRTEKYEHEYPFCWRCGTPLLYYARDSWFIGMSKLKQKLLTSNKTINWIPQSIKYGRFGEWLKEVKDWAISRERYWGTPLPIWVCKKCGKTDMVGSIEEIAKRAGKPKNSYWVMRHGEAENNVLDIVDDGGKEFYLTPRGRKQAEKSIEKLKKELAKKHSKIDLVITSDVMRARETSRIDEEVLVGEKLMVDKRLEEIHLGPDIVGCHDNKYHELFPTYTSKFEKRPVGGESVRDLRTRLWSFLTECETKYEGKNILLVSHEYPIWMLSQIAAGWTEKRAIAEKEKRGREFVSFAEIEKLDFKNIPRNDTGEIDLHRPYVDDVVFPCSCGGAMKRVPEVADVWFDSGSMPFAEDHFPFATKKIDFPADYIVEGVDQTRGWFYTLLAVATLLGKKAPYRNVISFGLVLDKNGQKMSKSKGNVVSPWDMIQKYGVDALRWYFYTVNPPGEPKKFDEADLGKVLRQFIFMMYNSYVFYKTYAARNSKFKIQNSKLTNVLDRWVLTRLAETTAGVTKKLDAYDIGAAGKLIEEFVNDLSKWYIRRSRRRLQKPENKKDYAAASQTLGYCLAELSKLLAPFMPFFADALYRSVVPKGKLSVHLEEWPEVNSKFKIQNSKLLNDMKVVRDLSSAALAKRAELGIKVRQPLQSLKIKNLKLKINKDLLDILKDEINVKEVIFNAKLKEDFVLDTVITPELKEEGTLRELIRTVQDLRQDGGLTPKDKIVLMIEADPAIKDIADRNKKLLMKEINASDIVLKRSDKFDVELNTKFESSPMWIGIKK